MAIDVRSLPRSQPGCTLSFAACTQPHTPDTGNPAVFARFFTTIGSRPKLCSFQVCASFFRSLSQACSFINCPRTDDLPTQKPNVYCNTLESIATRLLGLTFLIEMDPTSSHREAPGILNPAPRSEHTVAEQTAYLDDRNCDHSTDTTIECQNETEIVSRISSVCLRSLQQILQDTDPEMVPKRQLNVLRRVISVFILWDDGYGAQSGLLDAKLKHSN
jgi:hypothetical protein